MAAANYWYGKVVEVDNPRSSSEVAILDEDAQLVRWFPYRAESDLARVFRSMSVLEQPNHLFERK